MPSETRAFLFKKNMKYNIEELIEAVKINTSVCGVARTLGRNDYGSSVTHLKKRIIELGLDISHFKGTFSNKGVIPNNKLTKEQFIDKWLVNAPLKQQGGEIKKRIFKFGLKEYKCEICGIDSWLGNKIILEIHHIDENRQNNTLDNIIVLCPNCHSQKHNKKQ